MTTVVSRHPEKADILIAESFQTFDLHKKTNSPDI
jgi:hypothetical protein